MTAISLRYVTTHRLATLALLDVLPIQKEIVFVLGQPMVTVVSPPFVRLDFFKSKEHADVVQFVLRTSSVITMTK